MNAAYVLPCHGFPYLAGVLYHGVDAHLGERKLKPKAGIIATVSVIALASLLLLIALFGDYSTFIIYSVIATVTTALLLFSVRDYPWKQWGSPSSISLIGEMSFSLYLWNIPVIATVHHLFYDAPPVDQLGLAIGSIFSLTFLTYRLLELPLQRPSARPSRAALSLSAALLAALVFAGGAYGWYRAANGYHEIAQLNGTLDNEKHLNTYLNTEVQDSQETNRYLSENIAKAIAQLALVRSTAAAEQIHQTVIVHPKFDELQKRKIASLAWSPLPQRGYAYIHEQGIVENAFYSKKTILLITDSILLGWSGYVLHNMPDAYLDGLVGRSFVRGVDVVNSLKNTAVFPNVRYIVVELGSNGPVQRSDIQELLTLAGQRQILLIVPAVPRWWEAEVVTQYKWAQSQYPNVHLVPWDLISSGKDNYFVEDQVHLTWSGAQPLLFAILEQLYALGYQPPPLATGADVSKP